MTEISQLRASLAALLITLRREHPGNPSTLLHSGSCTVCNAVDLARAALGDTWATYEKHARREAEDRSETGVGESSGSRSPGPGEIQCDP